MTTRTRSLVIVAALLAAGSEASAQALYLAGPPTPGSAPAISGWTPFTMADDVGDPDQDDGIATLALPFAFPLYGNSHNSVDVSANGALFFGQTTPKFCPGGYVAACATPRDFPSATQPNGMVAFWMGDMDLSDGDAFYAVTGTAPSRIFSIRFTDWGAYDQVFFGIPSSKRTVQIDLYETTGQVRIYYGAMSKDTLDQDYASAGLENATGTEGTAALACSAATNRCGQNDWPTNQYVDIAPAVDPELVPYELKGSALRPVTVNGNPGFELDLTVSVRNRGQATATGFTWNVYLSTDKVLDPADTLVLAHATAETLAGGAQASWTDNGVQFARPPGNGSFHLLVQVDPPSTGKPNGEINEALETNNVLVGAPYVLGGELSGSITAPPATGPGELTDVQVKVRNSGIDPAGPFEYELWLSEDKTVDPATDKLFHTATLSLNGGEEYDQPVQVRFPTTATNGDYYVVMKVDPQSAGFPYGKVQEVNEGDNVAVSGLVAIAAADVLVEEVRMRSATPPHDPTSNGYFGEPVQITFRVKNQGGAPARNFNIGLLLSDNAVITLHDIDIPSTDPALQNLTLTTGQTVNVAVTVTMPTHHAGGTALPNGEYYLGVIADNGSKIGESNEANNIQRDPNTIFMRQPAPDFLTARVDAPVAAAVGEVMPVFRVLRNIGNRGNDTTGPAFEYRYVLSSNDIVSPQDIALNVVVNGVEQPTGEARLAVGGEQRQTDLLKLPSDISPGTYHVGLIVDSGGAVLELDETNNTSLSLGTVEILPSSLQVETRYLPDALVGLPYLQQLVASGGDGTFTWELETSEGALPKGLTLANDGSIAGTATADNITAPDASAVTVFTVKVTSAGRVARARLVMRTVLASGVLDVVSARLPTGIRGVDYTAQLAAVGGVPPYTWALVDGNVPDGVSLTAAGTLNGRPSKAYQEPLVFRAKVTDALGATAEGELNVRVVEPGMMAIATSKLADGTVNQPYAGQLLTLGGKAPFTWTVLHGELPEGLQIAGAAITGTPRRAGMFPLTLKVVDADGTSDQNELMLTVLPRNARFTAPRIPEAVPGETYSLDLQSLVDPGASLSIYSGELPTGLALERGSISGTVALDARPGAWNFILEITEETGLRTLSPLTIVVVVKEAEQSSNGSTGCSSAGAGGVSFAAALLAMLPMLRRVRRPSRNGLGR